LTNYSKGEEQRMEEFIKGIKDAGVEVVTLWALANSKSTNFQYRSRFVSSF
jgi:hypothetical protein